MKRPYKVFKREYCSYTGAKARCNNKKATTYEYYGGRGIKFKFNSFLEFLEHLGPRPEGTTLDRIAPEGDYEPGNVRWADKVTQHRNRRNNIYLTHEGTTKLLIEWCEELELSYGKCWSRLKVGAPAHDVLHKGDLRL